LEGKISIIWWGENGKAGVVRLRYRENLTTTEEGGKKKVSIGEVAKRAVNYSLLKLATSPKKAILIIADVNAVVDIQLGRIWRPQK